MAPRVLFSQKFYVITNKCALLHRFTSTEEKVMCTYHDVKLIKLRCTKREQNFKVRFGGKKGGEAMFFKI